MCRMSGHIFHHLLPPYNLRIARAIVKQINRPVASTSVLIAGPETTAGSMRSRATNDGSKEPIPGYQG